MLPADESLPAGDVSGPEIEFGLEHEEELVSLEGRPHAVAELQAFDGLGGHLFREEAECVSAAILRSVHRRIGVLDQRFDVFTMIGEDADSDTGRNRERMTVKVEWRRKLPSDTLSNHRNV